MFLHFRVEDNELLLRINVHQILFYNFKILINVCKLRAEKSKERKVRNFGVLNYNHQMLMVRARSNALSSEIPR